MKVLFPLLAYYPQEIGGPANTLYWQHKAISGLGVEVEVVTKGESLGKESELNLYGQFLIRVIRVHNFYQCLTEKIRKIVRDTEIIHTSSFFWFYNLIFIVLGLIAGKHIVISPRGEFFPSALVRKKVFKLFLIRLIGLRQKKIHFHVTSPDEETQVLRFFPNSRGVSIIPNFMSIPEKVETGKKLQILFLGRINPIKNIDLLILAFADFSKETNDNWVLKIAGKAIMDHEIDYLQELRDLSENLGSDINIEFLNGVYGLEKEQLISESYMSVLPSKSENFGNVVIESLSQGTPVIASLGTPWSILGKLKIGIWTKADVPHLKKAMEGIANLDDIDYSIMSKTCREYTIDSFDIDKEAHVWKDFYNDVLIS
jgi:glycosyltransferase involved in cell wall biosynthesis